MRPSQRQPNALRHIAFTRNYTHHAEGSVLVEFGKTKVICNATVKKETPRWMKEKQGWITAEYGMLPRSTGDRMEREATRGKQTGRTQEIQRLIGRSLRAMVDLKQLADYTIMIDCDVIQADGGTRTASITGSCIALIDALRFMQTQKWIHSDPLKHFVAAVSVGIYEGQAILDLDYAEDSRAETDMNIVMTEEGKFIEIQGTAENKAFSQAEFDTMMGLAKTGIAELIELQKKTLSMVGR